LLWRGRQLETMIPRSQETPSSEHEGRRIDRGLEELESPSDSQGVHHGHQ
jgi:hypothetical protein